MEHNCPPPLLQTLHGSIGMADPFTLSAGAVFSAIGTTFKLAEFCLTLKEVSSESRVFLTLIQRVREDLDEALRERHEKSTLLQKMPGKKAWIDGTIISVRNSLNDIGLLVENARIDVEKGKHVTLIHRFEWVLDNREKFVMREKALSTCHASLLSAIQTMHSFIAIPTSLPTFPAQQRATSTPASAFGSTTSLATNVTLSPPPEYDHGDVIDQVVMQEAQMLKSPLRRRPKTLKAVSAPAKEALIAGDGNEPNLQRLHSDLSIQDSLLEVRSLSAMSEPQLPDLDLAAVDSEVFPTSYDNAPHAHSPSNSGPGLNYHNHDLVRSISCSAVDYPPQHLDPTIFEVDYPLVPSKLPISHNNTESNLQSRQHSQSSPLDYLHFQSPVQDSGVTDVTMTQSEGQALPTNFTLDRKLSTAQERRRRARARFETG